ncbi:MAG: hypothetical protein A2163_06850 [Actinobacteria bacterium RBG_13_35_12]|nr:MAG: hypothetical protein A2163_06850 [Actinobacteria bacterium RBG_13_35_12]
MPVIILGNTRDNISIVGWPIMDLGAKIYFPFSVSSTIKSSTFTPWLWANFRAGFWGCESLL